MDSTNPTDNTNDPRPERVQLAFLVDAPVPEHVEAVAHACGMRRSEFCRVAIALAVQTAALNDVTQEQQRAPDDAQLIEQAEALRRDLAESVARLTPRRAPVMTLSSN